ncbi:MAG TPA: DUF4440 domain-containing protein [Vicinamibacterales bacterium]|nr:DUF4440 domain-containing protein [Vicinamibacterales bacterium]
MRRWIGWLVLAGLSAGCGSTVNVTQEKEALMRVDREWSASAKDPNKFLSYFAPDASVYSPGMPVVTGSASIRQTWVEMSSAPGFAIEWSPAKADVSASGDVGVTTGAYKMSMAGATDAGKYVTVWKKQSDGTWKVSEDIFNSDAVGPPPTAHVAVAASALTWGDPPPSLPSGAKLAVVSGDPSKPGPFVVRLQMPAAYRISPHWHPGDENVTVLSGTLAIGMGDTWDEAKMQAQSAGGFFALPAKMPHSALAKTAATIQVHGMGPLVLNYVNPADDPSKKK